MMPAADVVRLTRFQVRAVLGVLLLAIALAWGCGVAMAAPEGDYHLGSGDVLILNVFGEQEMNGKFAVGPTGTATFPLIGSQKLAALTLDDARVQITRALKDVIRNPHVTLTLDELASERKVYSTGYVGHPGPLALPFGATIADALAAALPLDVADLRRLMRHVFDNRDEARERGHKASAHIRTRHTWKRTALIVKERIRELDGR